MFIQKLHNQIRNHALAWSEIERRLIQDEAGKKDLETDHLWFEPDGTITIDGVRGYRMQEGSENQIISRFVPKGVGYLRQCQQEPKLFAENMNHWVYQHLGRGYLVRTRETSEGKVVRAVLSERYGVMDNLELFQGLSSHFQDDFVPVDMALSAAQFHLRLAHREGRDISRYDTGDLVHGGLHFSNSEIGASALMAKVITYRLLCTNGMISPEELSRHRKYHLGAHRDMHSFLQNSLQESGVKMERVLELLTHAQQETLLPAQAPALVAYLGRKMGWNQPLIEQIERALMSEDTNTFGLIQAITAAAKSCPPDERLQLEQQAGSLLTQDVQKLAHLALAEANLVA